MSGEERSVNDTLINMITNLKPNMKSDMDSFTFDTPIKRTASYNGTFDDMTPLKKIKRDHSLDASYIGSPREVRRVRADLMEARNTILSLEGRIQHMHGVRKEMQIMFDNESRSLQQQHERDRKSIEELELQLQSIRKREAETNKELLEVKSKYSDLKINSDMEVERLEKNVEELESHIHEFEENENEELIKLRRRVEELELVYDAAKEDADAHKKLVADLESRLLEMNTIERNLEASEHALQKAQFQIKELEYVKENYAEYQQLAKTQQQKLSHYPELEKENLKLSEDVKRLRDEIRNKLLLEEEVHDLKGRLVIYKEQEKKLVNLQTSHVQFEMNLGEWRSVARGICESNNADSTLPYLLRSVVERLQQQEITLTSEKVNLESQLKTAKHESKVARAELEKIHKHLTELQTNVQQRQTLIHRMQKKLLLISRERDSYRLQLDSYERDLTMCYNPSSASAPGGSAAQTQRERIESLERIVEGYRDMVTKLENDLQAFEPNTAADATPIRSEQISRLQEALDQLKNENTWLRERRDQLEEQLEEFTVGQDCKAERILHLAKNPLTECVQERENIVEKLKEEVDRLKRKIRNMEEGLEASKLGDISMSTKDVQGLKEQLKSAETQIQRLKEYFKSSMQEFRNVIYMLLGYKIDKTSNSQYKLTSMYADQPEDQICFQLNSEGALNLLENEFSSTLDDMVDLHLRHQKSIPVFLSAITMDLFNNRTMATKTFEIDV